MTNQTDATLQQRCAEIVEWRRTGVLPGTALREYAAEHWAGHHDDLQMAERDTSARAMELIAKLGTPQAVREPLTEAQRQAIYDKHCFIGDNGWEINWWQVIDEVEAAHGITKGGQHGAE